MRINEKRQDALLIRISELERNYLRALQKQTGLNASELIRQLIRKEHKNIKRRAIANDRA